MPNILRITLDWKKLFAFQQVEDRSRSAQGSRVGYLGGERVGGKLGAKIGGKEDGSCEIHLSHVELIGEDFDDREPDDEDPAQPENPELRQSPSA